MRRAILAMATFQNPMKFSNPRRRSSLNNMVCKNILDIAGATLVTRPLDTLQGLEGCVWQTRSANVCQGVHVLDPQKWRNCVPEYVWPENENTLQERYPRLMGNWRQHRTQSCVVGPRFLVTTCRTLVPIAVRFGDSTGLGYYGMFSLHVGE